jgi:hypothetical protein
LYCLVKEIKGGNYSPQKKFWVNFGGVYIHEKEKKCIEQEKKFKIAVVMLDIFNYLYYNN